MRVHYEKHAIHHFHDALHFSTEIGVPRSIDDVDVIIPVLESGILRPNGDSFLLFEVHRVHHAFLELLIRPESTGLPQQLVYECRLPVVDMGDDSDVTNMVHRRRWRIGKIIVHDKIVNEVCVQSSVTKESSGQIATRDFRTPAVSQTGLNPMKRALPEDPRNPSQY